MGRPTRVGGGGQLCYVKQKKVGNFCDIDYFVSIYKFPIYTKDPRFGSTRSFRERTNKKTQNGAYNLLDSKVQI